MTEQRYWQIRRQVESLGKPSDVKDNVKLLSAIWPEHAASFAVGRIPFTGYCDLSLRIRAAIDAGRLEK